MTRQTKTTVPDIARALGLNREGSRSPLKHPLPSGTVHDPAHHLLHSANWGSTPRAVLLVTGVPEEANELSRTDVEELWPC